jgi:hypothetical protein
LRLIEITHYCDYLKKEIYMHINRGKFLMKSGKRLSTLGNGNNKTKTNNRLGVAGACPAVVNRWFVVVAVPHLAAASKQTYTPCILNII